VRLSRNRVVFCWCVLGVVGAVACRPVESLAQESLSDHVEALVVRMRADKPGIEEFEPFLMLSVHHLEYDYRVQASTRLERQVIRALVRQGFRVVDEDARNRILKELERCYTEQEGLCRLDEVPRRLQPAGGWLEGRVARVPNGVELNLTLISSLNSSEIEPGEIVGTWSTRVPAVALDPAEALEPVSGVTSLGVARSDEGKSPRGRIKVVVNHATEWPAYVFIDDRGYGVAPVVATVPSGKPRITITARGYRPVSAEVLVPENDEVMHRVRLERGRARVRITSNAERAVVFIDGDSIGRTPIEKEIASGRRRIEVRKTGFDPFVRDVTFEHAGEVDVHANLDEHPGNLIVTCLQDAVTVLLDGAERGNCKTDNPMIFRDLAAGTYEVAVSYMAVELSLEEVVQRKDEKKPRATRDSRGDGLFWGIGYVGGAVSGEINDGDATDRIDVIGNGASTTVGFSAKGWTASVGGELMWLDEIEGSTGDATYFSIQVELNRYLFPRSRVRPFLGVVGQFGSLSIGEDSGGFAGVGPSVVNADRRAQGFGGAVQGGVEVRLSSQVMLNASVATYRTSLGEFDSGTGEVRGWDVTRGTLALRFVMGAGSRSP